MEVHSADEIRSIALISTIPFSEAAMPGDWRETTTPSVKLSVSPCLRGKTLTRTAQ